jgi:hypothetical protein
MLLDFLKYIHALRNSQKVNYKIRISKDKSTQTRKIDKTNTPT